MNRIHFKVTELVLDREGLDILRIVVVFKAFVGVKGIVEDGFELLLFQADCLVVQVFQNRQVVCLQGVDRLADAVGRSQARGLGKSRGLLSGCARWRGQLLGRLLF